MEETQLELLQKFLPEIVYAVRFGEVSPVEEEFLFIADSVQHILGFSKAEFSEDPRLWQDNIHPSCSVTYRNSLDQMLTTKRPVSRIYRFRHKQTCNYIWLEDKISPMLSADGGITGYTGVARDITETKRQEDLLRQSEEKFSTAFRTSPDSININRMSDGLFIEINDGFSRVTGYTNDDIRGKTSLDLNIWADPAVRKKMVNGLKTKGSVTNLEAEFVSKDGRLITALMSAGIITVDGEPCILSITRDISERKKAETALRDSENRFHSLFLESPIGVALAAPTCSFLEANDVFCKLVGYTRDDLIDLNLEDIIFEQDRKLYKELSAKLTKGLSRGYCVERRLVRKDGSVVWVKNTTSAVLDLDGNFQYAIEMIEDIDSRKLSEIALKESELRYKALVEQAGDAFFVHDLQGKILDVNYRACIMLGYTREELLRMNVMEIEDDFDKTEAQKECEKNKAGITRTFTGKQRRKDGTLLPVEVRFGNFEWKGQKQFLGLVRDISERVEAEKLIRIQDELLRLSGEMSKIGGWEFDTKTMCGTWTDEVARIHDLNPKKKVDVDFALTFYSGESRKKIDLAIKKAIEEATPYDLELEIKTHKGNLKWVRTMGIPELELGKVTRVRGFFQDITTQKHTEIERRKSEENYHSLFENMLNGFVYCQLIFSKGRPVDFIIHDVNKTFETLTGLKNVKGRKISEIIPGIRETDVDVLETYGKVAVTGIPESGEVFVKAIQMWLSITVYCPEKGYAIVIFDVISQRKKAEAELRDSEARYRLLAENSTDVIWILNLATNKLVLYHFEWVA